MPGCVAQLVVLGCLARHRIELAKAEARLRLAGHQRHGELAGQRLRRLLVHSCQHIVEQHAEGMLAGIHRRNDARLVILEGDDVVLLHGILQPLQVLEGFGARIVEHWIQIRIKHLAAPAIHLRDEGWIEVGQRLVVFVDERLLHPRLLQLEAGLQHLLPCRRHGDLVIFENLVVVLESDEIRVVRQAIELALVRHVAHGIVRNLVLVGRNRREVVLDRHEPPGQRPAG